METTIKNRLKTACAILAALLLSLIVLNFARTQALADVNRRINAIYQHAFYEICEQLRTVSVNYRKLLVASESGAMQNLLGEISRSCRGASANLSMLPVDHETSAATLKFVNQADDFAETLSLKLAAGDEITPSDYAAMQSLSDAAAQLSRSVNALPERYARGEIALNDLPDADLQTLIHGGDAYPTLLYDGAYSDGASEGWYSMLGGVEEITAAQAEGVLRAFIPADEIRYQGETAPGIPCYEFILRSGNHIISAAVTRAGGHVLYLMPENPAAEETMAAGDLTAIAEDFLRARGYGDVQMRYYSAYNGVITVQFAAVQDGVILYPDLIKLQLSMDDGAVIGFDARTYLKNHRERSLPQPGIDESTAEAAAGDRLSPESARLCIIPQNQREYLCYEIAASNGEDRFLAYIDAQTGAERELLQLMPTENGTLVM